ncbi:DNA-directed DNA polymerase gamma mip1 [Claviceps citrina]|nr:DNA-directed DNA polymerase gamma mip1 [Claviceps citrina]
MSSLCSAAGHVRRGPTAGLVRIARNQAHCRLAWPAHVRRLADVARHEDTKRRRTLAIPSEARYNEIGVQQLSDHVFKQIFTGEYEKPPKHLVELSKDHLRRHDLLGRNTDTSGPIAFDLPPLQGHTLDEHFHKLGTDSAEPFLSYAKEFAGVECPPKPEKWVRQSGWTKYYSDGRPPEAVEVPDETMLCFDTEVMWKKSPFAVMACASSPTAWYAWLSPWLLGETKNERQLIPLGDPTKNRVIVGHNVGYDRPRVLEEYDLKQSRNAFIDTMSLHAAVNGMCSRQRPTWMRHKKNRELRERVASQTPDHDLAELLSNRSMDDEEEELWVERSSVNSLRDVAKFHLDVSVDKSVRDDFGELDRDGILAKLDELLSYCADDVAITHRIYRIVFPNFLEVCPHPVSFAALRHLASVILPVDRSWDAYIANTEATYHKLSQAVLERLVALAEKAVDIKDDAEKWQNDPWMKQLDWSGQEIRMVKGKRKGDPPRPAARQKKPGMPRWYKDLFATNDSPLNITVRTRIAPLLLRLAWDGHPLFWSDKFGWTFRVPRGEAEKYSSKQMIKCEFDETEPLLRDDKQHEFFKLPHKDGPTARCANPMAKGYLGYFEKGLLSSEYTYAKEALEMNSSCSYWISARDRIMSQMVVYQSDLQASRNTKRRASKPKKKETGFILPQLIPMGTITRRAVERTWLTASNAKKNRVGSELKAMVKAPDGYCFVGADVDSQELWIASLVGDATFKIHGGNAIGFMTLEGTKAAGTDLHSRTASILGITRNDAKVFNYGRIYGAGLKFAATLLRQFNPDLSEKATMEVASRLYANTKGTKTTRKMIHNRPFWRGGTESFVFNKLEEFAEQERPRTPVLGAGITEALMSRFISKGGYLTSRINWAIQSSGVDYLHLLVVSMDFLVRRYNIDARLAITVHDEIRYLVKNEDKYRAAMALQVANIWTRAMFAQQVGIDDLPQSCAYFSAIDIDHVLRKEVDMDCVTPSHPTPISPGESLDIHALLDKGQQAFLDPAIVPEQPFAPRLDSIPYTPRTPVMESLQDAASNKALLIKAQIISDDIELADLIKDIRKTQLPGNTAKRCPKNVLPYHAHTQAISMEEPISVSEALRPKYSYGGDGQGKWSMSRGANRTHRPSTGL